MSPAAPGEGAGAPVWAGLRDERPPYAAVRGVCTRLPPYRHIAIMDVPARRTAAIFVPLLDVDGEPSVVLTRRSTEMAHNGGQWVFPGGNVQAGEDSRDAAVRETSEELGVAPADVRVLGRLNSRGPIMTGHVLDVFVGELATDRFEPDAREVTEVRVVPVRVVADPAIYRFTNVYPEYTPYSRLVSIEKRSPTHEFTLGPGNWLWGLQGDILAELLTALSGLEDADTARKPARKSARKPRTKAL